MRRISLYRKIKLYRQYLKFIKKSLPEMNKKGLNLRVDLIGRLYTVVNLSEDSKNYGPKLREKYITDYIKECDNVFNANGVGELVGIYDIRKLNELNYLVIFSYSQFNVIKFWRRAIVIGSLTLLSLIYLLISLF